MITVERDHDKIYLLFNGVRVLVATERGISLMPNVHVPNALRGNALTGDIILDDNARFGSRHPVLTLLGSGLDIRKNEHGRWEAWFDDLNVRGSMTVLEFLAMQIRTSNGDFLFTDTSTGKLEEWAVIQ